MGGNAISPEVTGIKSDFAGFREVFEDALEAEIAITQSFKNLASRCLKEQDFVTMEFLNWFLKEQREEEYKARRALELFEVIGEEGTGRWEIDKHVNDITYSEDQLITNKTYIESYLDENRGSFFCFFKDEIF